MSDESLTKDYSPKNVTNIKKEKEPENNEEEAEEPDVKTSLLNTLSRHPTPVVNGFEEFSDIIKTVDTSIDEDFLLKAWMQFESIKQQCVLEGNFKAWYASCAYVAIWQTTPSVSVQKKIHLQKLIKACKISILEFFDKLMRWLIMINAPYRLKDAIQQVQNSLAVSAVVHKKFLPIFRSIFQIPIVVDSEVQTLVHCKKFFELIWILFITLKKEFANTDLMNNYHLLLCVIDYIIHDMILTDNKEFLNPEFVDSFLSHRSSLEMLCQTFEGVVLDTKHFYVHCWKPRMKKFRDERIIFADEDLRFFTSKFDENMESLVHLYEKMTTETGEADERLFITDNILSVFDETLDKAVIEKLRIVEDGNSSKLDTKLLLRMSAKSCMERINANLHVQSPLSGKHYVITGEQYYPESPIAASLYNASKLEHLIGEDFVLNGSELERIFNTCRENPAAYIVENVKLFGNRIETAINEEKDTKGCGFDSMFSEMFKARRQHIDSLFYRFLEKVMVYEKNRLLNLGKSEDMSEILNKFEFISSVYACAIQLVLFTYDSRREFPWSIEVLRISPVHFYKIIELVIRSEPELSREMVKHLNRVEERILEELAWSLDSPLWQILSRRADGVPSSQSVAVHLVEGYNARMQNTYGLSQRYSNSPYKIQKGSGLQRRRLFYEEDSEPGPGNKVRIIAENQKPTTPMTLFFRKVYYLTAVRLKDMCERVKMEDKSRQRVWTLFEHVLRTQTSLMAGRHLDQNLMCCLYVIAKISKQDISFHDIMFHYRHQPQSCSRVYRRVLMEPISSSALPVEAGSRFSSVTSSSIGKRAGVGYSSREAATTASPEQQSREYDDLIKYYNAIFVNRVEQFVKKLQPGLVEGKEDSVQIIDMPTIRCHTLSPRRIITNRISILPMRSTSNLRQPRTSVFARPPAKIYGMAAQNTGPAVTYQISNPMYRSV